MTSIQRRDLALNRVYVTDPLDWATKLGTDYLWTPSVTTDLITGGTAGKLLSGVGWVTTSLTLATTYTSDFIASGDALAHNGLLMDGSGDIIRSPIKFGDYNHARAVQQILGYLPSSLVLEVGADWTVATADEGQSAFGFLEGPGTASVANDHLAAIYSDGTNFILRSGADTDTGAVIDNAYHVWKIVVRTGATDGVEWFIDGVSQGTIDTETDLFPVSFFGHALTTNRFNLGFVHVYYM